MTTTLRDIEIFSDLEEEELQILRGNMREQHYRQGDALFRQNDTGEELYIVEEGKISIEVSLPDGRDLEISVIPKGSFLGEMSIFEDAPRSATCRAKEPSRLLILGKRDLFNLIGEHPALSAKMMYRMLNITADRLKATDNFLSDMVQWGEAARLRAVTDEFTGLYNRRFLEDALESQVSAAKRDKTALSIAMVDLDHFGTLNKEYGEQVGDDVILSAVGVFKEIFKDSDILIRYGGDEFTFIMPGRSADDALAVCSLVCERLAALQVLDKMEGSIKKLTASIGIASYPDHGSSEKVLMEMADAALYDAKESGRNRARLAAATNKGAAGDE